MDGQAVPAAAMPFGVGMPTPPVYALTREDLMLRVFFSDGQIASKMRPHLDPNLFKDPDNRTLVTIIKKFERKYARVPTAQELVTGMGNTSYSLKACDKLMQICNTPMQALHNDYVLAMVESFFQERKAELILMNAAEAINERNTDTIRDLIAPLREAVTFSLHMDLGLNLYRDAGTALELLRERKECIPSGINDIRYYTGRKDANGIYHGGGYYRKTLTLYAGQPNVGKSLVLCSEAAHAYMNGYNTLYISLELSEDYVWQRLASNICGMDFYKILNMSAEECQAAIDARRAEYGPDVKVGELQVKRLKSTTTPAEIEAIVDSFEIAHGHLDFLVIDYIGIMKPSKGRTTESSMYADGVAKAEQIRDMLIDRNIAGLSAVQFNRSGYHNLDAGIESIEGSSGYAETCDLMISIVSDELLRSMGMMYHWILKNRFGPNLVPVVARCDFSMMRWFSPTQDEVNAYNEARAESDIQVNDPKTRQRMNGGQRPPRQGTAGGKVQASQQEVLATADNLTVPTGETDGASGLEMAGDYV